MPYAMPATCRAAHQDKKQGHLPFLKEDVNATRAGDLAIIGNALLEGYPHLKGIAKIVGLDALLEEADIPPWAMRGKTMDDGKARQHLDLNLAWLWAVAEAHVTARVPKDETTFQREHPLKEEALRCGVVCLATTCRGRPCCCLGSCAWVACPAMPRHVAGAHAAVGGGAPGWPVLCCHDMSRVPMLLRALPVRLAHLRATPRRASRCCTPIVRRRFHDTSRCWRHGDMSR
jgi:hypothetical protein